jgi:hypothetical protein
MLNMFMTSASEDVIDGLKPDVPEDDEEFEEGWFVCTAPQTAFGCGGVALVRARTCSYACVSFTCACV